MVVVSAQAQVTRGKTKRYRSTFWLLRLVREHHVRGRSALGGRRGRELTTGRALLVTPRLAHRASHAARPQLALKRAHRVEARLSERPGSERA